MGSGHQVNVIILVKIYSANVAERVKARIEVSVFSGQGLEIAFLEVDILFSAAYLID